MVPNSAANSATAGFGSLQPSLLASSVNLFNILI
jgi:hypothetical protein